MYCTVLLPPSLNLSGVAWLASIVTKSGISPIGLGMLRL